MEKISVVIITYNEEKNIARCIESVKDIADEILVIDSFSTDKTKEISTRYEVRFFEHPFEGYMQQKLWATNQATYDIILSLDADEVISPELKSSLLAVKENFEADGYTFNRLTNYLGKWIKHCGWYPDTKLRLWNRKKGNWTGINLHEHVQLAPDAHVKHLHGDLLHYSYYSIAQHINQFNKFTDIGAQEAFIKNKKASLGIALLKSCWKFMRDYFLKLGFLDGYYGFLICKISAFATFAKYIKLKELKKNAGN